MLTLTPLSLKPYVIYLLICQQHTDSVADTILITSGFNECVSIGDSTVLTH